MLFKVGDKVRAIFRGSSWEDGVIMEVRPGGVYVASNGNDTRVFDAWNSDMIRAKYKVRGNV